VKVFLTGGTGALGRYVVPALIERGHQLTVLARSADKAAQLERLGAAAARVDLFDAPNVADAFAGHDAVVNLATAIPPVRDMGLPGAWDMNSRIRRDGSAILVDAALRAGIERFVQESISYAYGGHGDDWIDETAPQQTDALTESVAVAEANAQRFAAARPANVAVVLRFGWFYGAGSDQTEGLIEAARGPGGPELGRRDDWIGSLYLGDAASAVAASLFAPSGTYNVADEPVTWGTYADALADAVGDAPWRRAEERSAVVFGERYGALYQSQRVSNRRFREATGWEPRYRSVREGYAAVVAGENQ
jgi:nucleoside-diphosphate-sugar epimerase